MKIEHLETTMTLPELQRNILTLVCNSMNENINKEVMNANFELLNFVKETIIETIGVTIEEEKD